MAVVMTLPNEAPQYIPVLQQEIAAHWSDVPLPSFLAAQIEQESNWKSHAKLENKKNGNEIGAGFGQFTKTNRFDTIEEMKQAHASDFKGWSWSDPYNVTYQLRGVVVKNHDNYLRIHWANSEYDRLAMTDGAYNSGFGGILKRKAVCDNMTNCDSGKWFGNMEFASAQAKKPAHGYRQSFAEITNTHVKNVMIVRRPKYKFMDGGDK